MAGAKKTRYPIIYVRGYAMTQSEMVETTSTPYIRARRTGLIEHLRITGSP